MPTVMLSFFWLGGASPFQATFQDPEYVWVADSRPVVWEADSRPVVWEADV